MMHNSTFDDRSPTNPSKKQIFDDIYTGETSEENPSKNKNNVFFQPFHEFFISRIYKNNNEFIYHKFTNDRRIHQKFPQIISSNLFQFEQLKKKTNFLLIQNIFFSVCLL